MRNKLRKRQNEGGFTLIELLIVIVVLGILAGLVVFGVATFRGDSEKQACESNAKQVEVAGQAWLAKNGGTITGADSAARITTLVTDKYMKAAPVLPTGLSISLAANGDVTSVCVVP